MICSDGPYVDKVHCGDASAAARQVASCATTGTLTLTLSGSNLANPASVKLGSADVACANPSGTATQITCTVAATALWGSGAGGNSAGHFIKVIDSNGKSSYNALQPFPAKLSFAAPTISSVSGDKTVAGGKTLTVAGSGFGPHDSAIAVTVGGVASSTVTWSSDSELTFVSRALSGTVAGNNP